MSPPSKRDLRVHTTPTSDPGLRLIVCGPAGEMTEFTPVARRAKGNTPQITSTALNRNKKSLDYEGDVTGCPVQLRSQVVSATICGAEGSLDGIERRGELVPSDSATDQPLDGQCPHGGEPPVAPISDRAGCDAEGFGQLLLRADYFNGGVKRANRRMPISGDSVGRDLTSSGVATGFHADELIQQNLIAIQSVFIAQRSKDADHRDMAEPPQPKAFSEFKDWLITCLRQRGIMQKDLAATIHISPQSITYWKRGGSPESAQIRKLADWAGVDYMDLRALIDKVPAATRRGRAQAALRRDPRVERIAAMLDAIAADDTSLEIALNVVQGIVDRSAVTQRVVKATGKLRGGSG